MTEIPADDTSAGGSAEGGTTEVKKYLKNEVAKGERKQRSFIMFSESKHQRMKQLYTSF